MIIMMMMICGGAAGIKTCCVIVRCHLEPRLKCCQCHLGIFFSNYYWWRRWCWWWEGGGGGGLWGGYLWIWFGCDPYQSIDKRSIKRSTESRKVKVMIMTCFISTNFSLSRSPLTDDEIFNWVKGDIQMQPIRQTKREVEWKNWYFASPHPPSSPVSIAFLTLIQPIGCRRGEHSAFSTPQLLLSWARSQVTFYNLRALPGPAY